MPPYVPRIGAMRETLALQSRTITTDTGTGFQSSAWSTYATVPAEYLLPTQGREAWEAVAVQAELPITFRIRYRSDVLPKHRALWRSQTLEIAAVFPVMAVGDRFLHVQCSLTQ